MNVDPLRKFISVDGGASAARLLGLDESATPLTATTIDEALRMRLAQVYNHPEGRSAEADEVRALLRGAATTLKSQHAVMRQSPSPGGSRRHNGSRLTPFDQQVLAILVGSGGWNAMSRARLIALAASHGVASQGLLKVISGLARSRTAVSPPASANNPAGPRAAASSGALAGQHVAGTNGHGRRHDPSLVQTTKQDSEETATHSLEKTLKLSVLYGLLTLAVAVVAIALLVPRPILERAASALRLPVFQVDPAQRPSEPAPDGAPIAGRDASHIVGAETVETDREREPARPSVDWGVAQFEVFPTFRAALPPAAYSAKEASMSAPKDLDGVARRVGLAVRAEGIAESVFRTWADVLENAGASWVLLEPELLRSIERGVVDVLVAADSQGGSPPETNLDRLLQPLLPPVAGDPLDFWRGSWAVRMLAVAAFHPDLSRMVRARASHHLTAVLEQSEGTLEDGGRISPSHAASLWLNRALPELLASLAEPERAFEMWELWIAANQALGHEERFNSAMVRAVHVILVEHPSSPRLASAGFGRDGEPAEQSTLSTDLKVIGRLLQEIDFDHSTEVQRRFLALFDDERIDSADLWLLTSMLANSPRVAWFVADHMLVVSPHDELSVRRRIKHNIENAWPELGSQTVAHRAPVDPIVGERWLRVAKAFEGESIDAESEAALLRQVLRAVRVSEAAAYLEAKDSAHAARVLDLLGAPDRSDAHGQRPPPVGQRRGGDGGWSAAYEEARRDVDERMRLLDALRQGAGGDLGSTDAAVFVREVYRGSPAELRELAQSILVSSFGRGPMVAQEMLDQLPSLGAAPRNLAIARTLSRFIGRDLPPLHDGTLNWSVQARLGLVEHLLALVHEQEPFLDALADDIGASLASEADALGRVERAMGAETPMSPSAGAASVFNHWRERAHGHAASRLGPEIESFERRHAARMRMAEGPIQETIALRIGTLELMGLVTRAEGTGYDHSVMRILDQSATQRGQVPSALVQAVHVERAMVAMWRARLHVQDGYELSMQPRPPLRRPPPTTGRRQLEPLMTLALMTSMLPSASSGARPYSDEEIAAQLEALMPERPLKYFELAEVLADTGKREHTELARHLFALAGALDTNLLGRSACLALADLAPDEHARRRLLALADVLSGGDMHIRRMDSDDAHSVHDDPDRLAQALALGEAFSLYRKGQGPRAGPILRREDVRQLLAEVEGALPWPTVQAFIDDCLTPRPRPPSLPEGRLIPMLQVERFLLGGAERTWASELAFSYGRPLIEIDPDRIDRALDVDVSRPYFRGGQWRSAAD